MEEIKMKKCAGPLHPPGGSLIPISDFTFNKTGSRAGTPLSRCKYCRSSGNRKSVPAAVFEPLVEVLFDGRNIAQVADLVKLDRNLIKDLQKGKRKRINKKTFLALKRAVAQIPREKTSIGPKSKKTKRNGLKKLSYEERAGLKSLISQEQKKRYKLEKKLLRHVV